MARPEGDHAAILRAGRWKEAVQGYLAAISYADAMIGRLIDALDRSADRDDTLIVLWGDHGWHPGEKRHWRKFALWEETPRAPLLWVVPGSPGRARSASAPWTSLGIDPMLTDLWGLPTPGHVEGRSLRQLLGDPTAPWDHPALTTYRYRNHAVRTEGWCCIRYADGGEERDDEAADPDERTHLAGDPRHAATKAGLAKAPPARYHPDIGRRRGGGATRQAAREEGDR